MITDNSQPNHHAIFYDGSLADAHIADILKEIYMDRVYERIIHGRKDLTIIDFGGNIGLTSMYFSPFAKKVFTLEPDPFHVATIRENLDYNKIDNVEVFQLALANENGKRKFHFNTNTTMASLSPAVDDKSQEEIEVKTITIEDFMTQNKIEHVDFAKVDVEGEEFNVICGKHFEHVTQKVDSLLIELHNWANRNFDQIPTALRDYGYQVQQIPSDAVLFYAERRKWNKENF